MYSQNVLNPMHQFPMGSVGDQSVDPPLLEELGIDVEEILRHVKQVVLFAGVDSSNFHLKCDIGGPLVIMAVFGFLLTVSGQSSFESIYTVGVTGIIGMWLLLNLMSGGATISLYTTLSILGYSLLPACLVAFLQVFFNLRASVLGQALSLLIVAWSTATSSRFLAAAVYTRQQRWLVAYPLFLIYAAFVLIAIA